MYARLPDRMVKGLKEGIAMICMNRDPNKYIIEYQNLIRAVFLRMYKLFYYSLKNVEELVNFAKHGDTENQ